MKITDILRAEHTVFHHLFDHVETVAPRLKSLAEVKLLAALIDKIMAAFPDGGRPVHQAAGALLRGDRPSGNLSSRT